MVVSPQLTGVSVLICTYNGASRLIPTLKHLAQQVMPVGVPWEILLVDNNSTDDTAVHSVGLWNEFGAPAPFRILHQPKPGKQFALEMAYDAARYEFMCIVDDDNWLQEGYLWNGYSIMVTDATIGLLGGRNVGAFEIEPPAWFPLFQSAYAVGEPVAYTAAGKQKFLNGEITEGVLWGAGLFMRHAIWHKLRLLRFKSFFTGRQGEKQLTAGEDDELSYVAQLLGYKLWYDEKLRCTHYMTAGRLTEEYLKKLCYAAPRSYPNLSAYQKVLKDSSKYRQITPWAKDWVYVFVSMVRNILSWRYFMSYFRPDLLAQITTNQRVLTCYYFTLQFDHSKKVFNAINNLRERAQSLL